MYNGFNCNVTLNSTKLSVHNLGALETLDIKYAPVSNEISFPVDFMIDPSCSSKLTTLNFTSDIVIIEGQVQKKNLLFLNFFKILI